MLGCGTVGRGLVELIQRNRALIHQRSGVELSLARILVRDLHKQRPGVDRDLLTVHPDKVINNGCDLVVEVVGGIEPARTLIQRSLATGKHVVTANKALLAVDGFALLKTAEDRKLRLGFEASVCGGIPIIRVLRNGLVGNQIQSLSGILNGTCNYILTRMTEDGMEFSHALAEAQAKGFAEADPTLDIDGRDAAQKLKILAELAFNVWIDAQSVHIEGIRGITADDVQAASELGYVIKPLATAELAADVVTLEVRPVLLPHAHQLAAVRDENNAVLVRGDAIGQMLFSGKGAGSLPSASAVLSDIVDIACYRGGFASTPNGTVLAGPSGKSSKYYLRFPVTDPSAIGPITTILERSGVPVARAAALWAKHPLGRNQVRVLTHACSGGAIETCIAEVGRLGLSNSESLGLPIAE